MYIRINDNSIRFRVSKQEASQLIDGKHFSQTLTLSPSHSLTYAINSNDQENQFVYDEKTNGLLLTINKEILMKELNNRPNKEGIVFTHSISAKTLSISLEIDLKSK